MNHQEIAAQYTQSGFVQVPRFLASKELATLRAITARFHQHWLQHNQAFYQQRAINSAYLTHPDSMSSQDRLDLFRCIGSAKFATVITPLFPGGAAFMNTQLFFDPANPQQLNYWHRDTQYMFPPEEEMASLGTVRVLHYRIALRDEPGIELVPGTHKSWDTVEELNVRLAQNERSAHEDLARGIALPLKAGDLLIFDAAMLHRGLYGQDRCALDILFCQPIPALLKYAEPACLPNETELAQLVYPDPFIASRMLCR